MTLSWYATAECIHSLTRVLHHFIAHFISVWKDWAWSSRYLILELALTVREMELRRNSDTFRTNKTVAYQISQEHDCHWNYLSLKRRELRTASLEFNSVRPPVRTLHDLISVTASENLQNIYHTVETHQTGVINSFLVFWVWIDFVCLCHAMIGFDISDWSW